ncbi:hypothetical protein I6N90_08140 [Paenibacillus sp. GSMTC-2017]|uniref:hypothetical protein n=1 Tax=Paenibacillus sp. GSMTC-2017 TaxID=2794350 RepID=UPI0018D9BCC7|nr:hypothetical protein [Paenibacillus sp. GSMTC-2017]MBH5317772.1 hypothetical protein [Paenibacillus sp. GSMTC-2017]
MSRSWERKVRKNMSKINKDRKKSGTGQIVFNAEKTDTFKGRNIMAPILILAFVTIFTIVSPLNPNFKFTTMFWVTIGLYIGLAALLYFRKPYLTIGKDYVVSRRFGGHKRLGTDALKGFRLQNGYVIVLPKKGGPWTFSRLLNRFPTDDMTVKVKAFAATHGLEIDEK